MNIIELERVSKQYGSLKAVDNLSLSVQQGQVVSFLGPNGAGKTTTLSMMMGLASPSSGQVRVFGSDPRQTAVRSRMGVMLQESDLPGMLTVGELLDLFSSFYPHALERKSALELADLSDQVNKKANTLSGGQKRRLIFALSIVGDPELIFLDEPTVAMDLQSRSSFWETIKNFRKQGKTIILTTHHLEEADAISDQIIVIDKGRIIAQGDKNQIKAKAGGSKVSFKTQGITLATLEALPGVVRASYSEGYAELISNTPEKLLQELFGYHVPVADLEVTRASLEEAFLSLTAKIPVTQN
jgi:ABC-2 type transport system ATP-binding protein